MKFKLALAVMPILVLGACAEEAAEPAPVEEEVAAPTASDGGPLAGEYELTNVDGDVTSYSVTEDGAFSATSGDETATGSITNSDEGTCLDVDGDEEGAVCYTNGDVAEDGSWTSTSPDGDVSTVRRVVAEEAAAE